MNVYNMARSMSRQRYCVFAFWIVRETGTSALEKRQLDLDHVFPLKSRGVKSDARVGGYIHPNQKTPHTFEAIPYGWTNGLVAHGI